MPSKIRKRGKNSYELTVSAGYNSAGEQITYRKTVSAIGPAEAKRLYNEYAAEVQRGNITITGKLKIKDFAERWYKEYCEKNLAPKTQRSYKLHIDKRIAPALGNIDINKLKPLHIIEFLNNLTEPGLREDGKEGALGEESIMYCFRVLSSMLNDAVQWQIIPNNPAERVKPPTVKKKKQNAVYSEEQTQIMLNALESEPLKYQLIVLLDVVTGLRLGELCGLEWPDFNLLKSYVDISRASQSLSGLGTFSKAPKSDSSVRRITLPEGIISLLKEHKAEQNAERLRLGSNWHNSSRLFTQWNGKPIYVQTPSKWFTAFLKRYNKAINDNEKLTDEQKKEKLLPIIRFHDLRHTSATLLVAKGVPLKNISSRLGHADIRTTANIYSHALQSVDKQIANTMDDLLFNNAKQAAKKEQA